MQADLFWIEGPWRGRLAIMARPRGGDWLMDEMTALKSAGMDVVVSTLTADENAELDLSAEPADCARAGLECISFPIVDRGVPSISSASMLVRDLEDRLSAGKNVAIHCRQGIGRSAIVAACLLVVSGIDPATALERIRLARGCPVPDTVEQKNWVHRFASDQFANHRQK